MDPLSLVDLLSRWIHVGTAILLFGGVLFQLFVLLPVLATRTEEERADLLAVVTGRWRKFVGIGIGLLLLSGLWNYVRAFGKPTIDKGLYHMLVDTKMLLSFGAFFLASVLAGRSPKFEGMRQNRKKWLTILALLMAVIVALAGTAKIRAYGVTPTEETTTEETTTEEETTHMPSDVDLLRG